MILEAFPGRGRIGSNMNPARREENPTGERGGLALAIVSGTCKDEVVTLTLVPGLAGDAAPVLAASDYHVSKSFRYRLGAETQSTPRNLTQGRTALVRAVRTLYTPRRIITDRMGTQGVEGEFEASLASMNPYIAWVGHDAGVWATTGFGWGTIDVNDAVADRSSTLVSSMLAAGGFREIMASTIGSLHLRAEGMSSRIDVSGNMPTHIRDAVEPDHINESTVRMRRGRVMLDWRTPRKEYGEYNAEIRFEGGMRYDYNDLDTGISGAEVGGGIRLDGPLFRVYGNARMFTHLDHQEWGVQGLVELRSRQENGLSLQIHPTYGDAASGLNQLWENGVPENLTSGSMNGRVSTVLAYRHPKLAPYTRFNYRDHRTPLCQQGRDTKGENA